MSVWGRNLIAHLRDHISEIAQAVNDDLLVRNDFIRLLDADYTALISDRMLLCFPSTNRTITLPDPDADPPMEPHPLVVKHAGSSNTVTIDPAGSVTIDGSATVALSAGDTRVMVAVSQALVDQEGAGSVGWFTVAS